MVNYNTFLVIDCNSRKPVLTTSSARKANKMLTTGFRVEIWNNNRLIERITIKDKLKEKCPLQPYIELEKEYHRLK